jgi:hypothetical protein
MAESDNNKVRWWLSDGLLGAMVVILTAATAFAAYQSALTGIEGDDLDFETQKNLVVATGSFLNGNAELIQDLQAYDAYRFLINENPAEAAVYLERMSDSLRAKLKNAGSPFDDDYLVAAYAEANALLNQVEEQEILSSQVDDRNRVYELAGFIFAIGLAATAWASLVDAGRRIRIIFLILALVCLVGGFGVLVRLL